MRVDEALAGAAASLAAASGSPRLDAEVLLAAVLDRPKSWLYAHPEDRLSRAAAERFAQAVATRQDGVPLPYITGEKEFWSLNFIVEPSVLVPRPETECLVELALRQMPDNGGYSVVDLGTGSGAIAVAIASERPNCRMLATDISRAALSIARLNAARHGIENIEFLQGDWGAAIRPASAALFDLAVSNPPYVRADDPALAALRHEPRHALVAGDDGLAAIRTLARDAANLLRPAGLLLLEHAPEQRDPVAAILAEAGWRAIECHADLAGRPRVTQARSGNKRQ